MTIKNVFNGKDFSNFMANDKLLDKLAVNETPKEVMTQLVEDLADNLVRFNDQITAYTTGWWYVGYYKNNSRIYSRYDENTNTFEIFRVGDLSA